MNEPNLAHNISTKIYDKNIVRKFIIIFGIIFLKIYFLKILFFFENIIFFEKYYF